MKLVMLSYFCLKIILPFSGHVLKQLMDLSPSALYTDFSAIHIDVTPRACHSFRRTYAALCDFYDQPYREEVAWVKLDLFYKKRVSLLVFKI